MRAFIVRPFGSKHGIDFEKVERDLVGPALKILGITGRTTGEVIRQGNIRSDMFAKLLAADLVVADVSLPNANVFYELGIRHALRKRSTFLIKATGDAPPFDLLTDRYFLYDADHPESRLQDLVAALRASVQSQVTESPVFQLVPHLPEPRPEVLRLVPFDFVEEVERAARRDARGVLQLLGEEAAQFDWALEGLRVVGRHQFELGDHAAARRTWERVQESMPLDAEANCVLATVYERLEELDRSDLLLQRILRHGDLGRVERTEARALLGRNAKSRWVRVWRQHQEPEARRTAALRSPHLQNALDGYVDAAREDRNNVFAVLNAVSLCVILTELASSLRSVWRERFENQEDADRRLAELQEARSVLATAAELAVDSDLARAERQTQDATWARISTARLALLTSSNPRRVAHLFGAALASAQPYARASNRDLLLQFADLGVHAESAAAAIEAIDALDIVKPRDTAKHVVLFAGHRIDTPKRLRTRPPRFPAESAPLAKELLQAALQREVELAESQGRELHAISGGASGGDLLFQEACRARGISTSIYLARSRFDYIRESVQDSGPEWVEKFDALCDDSGIDVQVMSENDRLPRWLGEKPGYTIHERSAHWILHCAASMADSVAMIALWDGEQPDGRGGTYDIIRGATQRGFRVVQLDARALVDGV